MVCPCYFNSRPLIEIRIIVILGYFATVHAIIRRILLVLFSVVNQVNQSGIHSILMLKLIVGFSKIRRYRQYIVQYDTVQERESDTCLPSRA